MTVLSRFERLECAGIWRATAGEQRRDVFVSMGKATLVINDSNDVALSHWSLPAVERMNPGRRPALYRPGDDSEEELEIDDGVMIEAIGTVHRALARARPHPGRLRRSVFAAILAAVLALAILWLPGALVRHTAAVIPEATRADIGEAILRELEPMAGRACRAPEGVQALRAMQNRLFGEAPWQVVIIPGGPARTAHLPGGYLLLHRSLLEAQPSPDVAAGALLAEAERALQSDPLVGVMQSAGPVATFRLLTRGQIGNDAVASYAKGFLTTAPASVTNTDLLARFKKTEVSSKPYARLADPIEAAALSAGDPFPAGTPVPILDDAAWLRLQAICGN
ncbi:MAG: hypothetical protein AAGH83_11250 [Pseudomonadota bacterium]